MTYNMLMGTLNPTHSLTRFSPSHIFFSLCALWPATALLEYSFPRLFVPWNIRSHDGTFVLGIIRSLDHSFPGIFVSRYRSFPGTFAPWTVLYLELSFLGPFVPWTIRSRDRILRGKFIPLSTTVAIHRSLCT